VCPSRCRREVVALSKELGVSEATLYLWKRQALIEAGRAEGVKSFVSLRARRAPPRPSRPSPSSGSPGLRSLFSTARGLFPKRRCHVAKGLSDLGFKENMACRVTGVPRSCYSKFRYQVPSDRQIRRLVLGGLVADIHKRSRRSSGRLRIRAALMREQNIAVKKKLILSIMRELGIKGLPEPKRRRKNRVNEATEEDLVQRNFTVDRPNVLCLCRCLWRRSVEWLRLRALAVSVRRLSR
jgi:putative transposase